MTQKDAYSRCVGGLCTRLVHQQAAWIAAAVLVLVLGGLVVETRRLDQREEAKR
jgi:hypothetical protein